MSDYLTVTMAYRFHVEGIQPPLLESSPLPPLEVSLPLGSPQNPCTLLS